MTLQAVDAGPSVVVCNTCRLAPDLRDDAGGRRGGALLADALRQAQAADPAFAHIAVQEMPCLFACSRHCTIHIRAPELAALGRVDRHRAVNRALGDITRRVHALALDIG